MSENPVNTANMGDPYDFNEQHPRDEAGKKNPTTLIARKPTSKRVKVQKEMTSPPSSKVMKLDSGGNDTKQTKPTVMKLDPGGNDIKQIKPLITADQQVSPAKNTNEKTDKLNTEKSPVEKVILGKGDQAVKTIPTKATCDKNTQGKGSLSVDKITNKLPPTAKTTPKKETINRITQGMDTIEKSNVVKGSPVEPNISTVKPTTLQTSSGKGPPIQIIAGKGANVPNSLGTLPLQIQQQSAVKNKVGVKAIVAETCNVEVQTDADCLGPCEPGTSVMLEGIVWHESDTGILVINVSWRGKKYIGTLLDISRHEWAPPNFSPGSPTHRRDVKSPVKLRGRKGKGKRPLASLHRSPRKWGSTPSSTSKDDVSSEPTNSSNTDEKPSVPTTKAPETYVICTEPKCSKKFRGSNCQDALEYHKIHAHASSVAVTTTSMIGRSKSELQTNNDTSMKPEPKKEIVDPLITVKEPEFKDLNLNIGQSCNKNITSAPAITVSAPHLVIDNAMQKNADNVQVAVSTNSDSSPMKISNILSVKDSSLSTATTNVSLLEVSSANIGTSAMSSVFVSSSINCPPGGSNTHKKTNTPPVAVLKPLVPQKDGSAKPLNNIPPQTLFSGSNTRPPFIPPPLHRSSAKSSNTKPSHLFPRSFSTVSGRSSFHSSQINRSSGSSSVLQAVAPVPATVMTFNSDGHANDRRSSHTYSDISDASDQEMDTTPQTERPISLNRENPSAIEDRLFCNEELGAHSPPPSSHRSSSSFIRPENRTVSSAPASKTGNNNQHTNQGANSKVLTHGNNSRNTSPHQPLSSSLSHPHSIHHQPHMINAPALSQDQVYTSMNQPHAMHQSPQQTQGINSQSSILQSQQPPQLLPPPPSSQPPLQPHPHHAPLMYPYMPFIQTSQMQSGAGIPPMYAAPYLMTYPGLPFMPSSAPPHLGGGPPGHNPMYPRPPGVSEGNSMPSTK